MAGPASGPRATQISGADTSLARVPPYSSEAEQGVIASVLLDNDLMNNAVEVLRPEDFYVPAHRKIFGVMLDLYERGRAIDEVTLTAAIRDGHLDAEIGGLAYLAELVGGTTSTFYTREYIRLVKEKSILRRMIGEAQEIVASAYQGVTDVDVFLDQAERAVFSVAEEKIRPSYYSMADMAKEAMREIEKLFDKKELITGVPSGYRDLDRLTAGFQRSDLVVVAARPSMGKTSLCLNVAAHVALRSKIPVLIFSLEMSRQQLVQRILCADAQINSSRLRTGFISQDEINKLVASVGRVSEAPIYIDDSGSLTALEVRAKARRLKRDKNIGLVIIDYLQMMRGTQRGSENRVQEISEISRSLKALAKELNIPVIAISQLNRGVESRDNKRPQMSDLRESGAIEQDADLILFVYREEVYKKEETPQDKRNVAEIIIGKHRNGPIDTVELTFLSQYTLFKDHARADYE